MRKQLETPGSAHWNSPLLDDLGFIKKNLRYPVNKRTIWPLIWMITLAVFMLLLAGTILAVQMQRMDRETTFSANDLLPFLVMGLVLFTLSTAIYRRARSFRFISIRSNFIVSDNIKLIRQFLQKQQIAFFQNPDAPEVFQISSRVLDQSTGQREIMVFIADDNRILLNSHFSSPVQTSGLIANQTRGLKEISTGAHKKMAADLKQWLKNNEHTYTHQFNLKITGN